MPTETVAPTFDADVLIVGAGPVGLTIANFLGLAGVSTLVIEQLPELIDYPRAIGIDDEALRTLQSVGLTDLVEPHITPDHWLRFMTAKGRCFASLEPRTDEFGWSRRNAFMQPVIDRILLEGLQRFAHVDVRFGHGAHAVGQDSDGVWVDVQAQSGARTTLRARYLVAGDGGNSFVRRSLGIGFEGRTKPNQWVVIDLQTDPLGVPNIYAYGDPERPYVSAALPHGMRRFEFMVMPHETQEQLVQPEVLRRLIGKVVPRPEAVDLVRQRVYTHNARLAGQFRLGRVLLAGDAAHIMPVWQGQGYNSGMRDAFNLGWKLAMVARGEADEKLLDTYEQERRGHARSMIRLSEVSGDLFMPRNAFAAAARDLAARWLNRLPSAKRYLFEMRFKPLPRYERGAVLVPDAPRPPSRLARWIDRRDGTALGRLLGVVAENRESLLGRLLNGMRRPPRTPVGTMFPQPWIVGADGGVHRLDDVIGNRFAIVAFGVDPVRSLGDEEKAIWIRIGARFVCARPVGQLRSCADVAPEVLLVGDKSNRLKEWFGGVECGVAVLRPDRIVAAICSPQELGTVTRALVPLLHLSTGR